MANLSGPNMTRNPLACAALVACLSGCAAISPNLAAISNLAIVGAGVQIWNDWPEPKEAAGDPPPPDAALYCYRTLAGTDCHAEALGAPENTRLVAMRPAQEARPANKTTFTETLKSYLNH